MQDLVFAPPSKDDPGFLRRMREAVKFSQLLKESPTVETMDGMVEFLSQYVTEPADPEVAKEALWDATENQFLEMLKAIGGEGDVDPTQSAAEK